MSLQCLIRALHHVACCCCIKESIFRSTPRSVLFVNLINGRLQALKIVTVHITEVEACVATITRMVKEALRQQGPIVLTDVHDKRIIGSEETRGRCSCFAATILNIVDVEHFTHVKAE